MKDALIALLWGWLSLLVSIALAILGGLVAAHFIDRKSERSRAADVQDVERLRAQAEWDAKKRRSELLRAHKARQGARQKLAQFHRRGGNDAA